jgi:hypothetical protein
MTIIPRLTADAIAAPTPCRNRAATSIPAFTASPHSSEASVNRAMPATNTRFLPTRSPSRPASSSRPPKAIRYAFTTQGRLAGVKPRLSWIVGSATATMLPSKMTISMLVQSTISASRRDPPRDADRDMRLPPKVHDL